MDINEALNEAAAEAAKDEYALAYDILARAIDRYVATSEDLTNQLHEAEREIARLEALRIAHHATNVRRVTGETCLICHPTEAAP